MAEVICVNSSPLRPPTPPKHAWIIYLYIIYVPGTLRVCNLRGWWYLPLLCFHFSNINRQTMSVSSPPLSQERAGSRSTDRGHVSVQLWWRRGKDRRPPGAQPSQHWQNKPKKQGCLFVCADLQEHCLIHFSTFARAHFGSVRWL